MMITINNKIAIVTTATATATATMTVTGNELADLGT
jgi:hypothetical protein